MSHVFISYSRADSQFVDGLIGDLQQAGFPVWLDREAISGGAAWRGAISQAIRDCEAFLVVLSPQAVSSRNVTKELALADEHHRAIIPVRYQDCDVPPDVEYQLAGLQWVDYRGRPPMEALEDLLVALRAARGAHGGAPAPTPRPAPKPAPPAPPVLPRPTPAPAPAPIPTPQHPATLPQLLPGVWQIQISAPYVGLIGEVSLEIFPNGLFRGQIVGATGMAGVEGQWQANLLNQATFQGQQSNGFQVMPYLAVIQFTQVSPAQLAGMTQAGELLQWHRVR